MNFFPKKLALQLFRKKDSPDDRQVIQFKALFLKPSLASCGRA